MAEDAEVGESSQRSAEDAEVGESSQRSAEDAEVGESSQRSLAYVEVIQELNPIPGATIIEVATILGWKVVVKKGLYRQGDLVIYAEIDSILPPWPTFVNDKLDRVNFRIRTIKLRNQISQGYCIPLSALKEHPTKKFEIIYPEGEQNVLLQDKETNEQITLSVGTDVTNLIGIKKYEVVDTYLKKGSMNYRKFPTFILKTDQPRVQNLSKILPQLPPDLEFEVTEKLEGTSITVFYSEINRRNPYFGICSRNFEFVLPEIPTESQIPYKVIVLEMGLKQKLEAYKKNIALQGELIGPKIQSNIYNLKGWQWKIFDVFLIEEQRYATPSERTQILSDLSINNEHVVPILHKSMKLTGLSIPDLLQQADGFSQLNTATKREGIVFKSLSLVNQGVFHFKAVSNSYLLSH